MSVRRWLPLLLLGIGAARIASTWTTFTQTYDEPFHLACGMEWWDLKTYTRERQHPPLARIAIAAIPYWVEGLRDPGSPYAHLVGNALLGTGKDYVRRLAMARAGNLPFFLLFCVAIWRWTVYRAGPEAGLGALFVASTLPPILGQGGLATTDMAPAALFAAFGWRFDVWQRERTWPAAFWAGLCLACGLASKITFLALGPLAALLLVRRWPRWRQLAVVVLIGVVGLLAFYRFKKEYTWPHEQDKGSLVKRAWGLRAFFTGYYEGYKEVEKHNKEGHWTYLNGRASQKGDWRFFPTAFVLKTPLAVLALFFTAVFVPGARWAWVIAAVPLALLTQANINLGIRHALPAFAGISIAAGILLVRYKWAAPLVLWSSLSAHPDYAFWFNELAQGEPGRYLAESDLDWGQDLHRTVAAMDELGIAQCRLAYFGTADVQKLFPGRFVEFRYEEPAAGCTASSVRHFYFDADIARQAGAEIPFGWLEKYPVTRQIGQSMRLYVIDKVH